jgi:16S rRNA (adenine1518-N6/adenine1519-N6)-dimethyltransferase
MNKSALTTLLKQHNIEPKKRMGQNFLIDKNILQKIIKAADLSRKDTVLEIGSGLGTLTQELAQKAKKVIAVEKDKKLAEILKEILKDYKNIEIIQGDVLRFDIERSDLVQSRRSRSEGRTLNLKNYKLVANLPYYITSPAIRMFLESKNLPQEMTLLTQKEVAQRICAKPPRMNLLAVSVQFYGQPKIISYISKNCFWPRPKVDSAIIKIGKIKKPKNFNIKRFFQIVRSGFSSPRKQLVNNLSKMSKIDREKIKKALTECNLDIQVRAGNLSVENWIKLSTKINSFLMV